MERIIEDLDRIAGSFSNDILDEILEKEFTSIEREKIAEDFEKNKDYLNAFVWYKSASSLGNINSFYKIGTFYEFGYSVKKNISKAYTWYKKAADLGNKECLKKLADEYYNGTEHCPKDIEKAKQYWISIYLKDPCAENECVLNKLFPGWKKTDMREFFVLRFKNEKKLEELANKGISAAAYWLGVHYLGKKNSADLKPLLGYTTDVDKARRWLLKAAADNYLFAIDDLKTYYNIDAQEASTAKDMFDCSCKYSNKSSEELPVRSKSRSSKESR